MKYGIDVQSIKFVSFIYIMNKITITLIAFLASFHALHFYSIYPYIRYVLIDNFFRWDSGWYQGIASHGYSIRSAAFFPLFPLLMHVLAAILPISLKVAGICIANGCFLGALYFSYLLIRLDYDEFETKRIIWLMGLYPTSYYYTSGYTESMYLLFFTLSLYCIRKAYWPIAGIAGFFSGITRNTGVFLSIPFVLEYLHIDSWSALVICLQSKFKKYNVRSFQNAVWLCLIPLSIVSYMLYLKIRLGDAMAFSHAEKYFGRSFLNPFITLKNGIVFNTYQISAGKAFSWLWVYSLLELIFVGIVLFCLFYGIKRIRLSYWVLLLALFLIPLAAPIHGRTTDYFVSFSRYSLVMFPMYIALYECLKKYKVLYACTLITFVILLILMVTLWSNGAWVS